MFYLSLRIRKFCDKIKIDKIPCILVLVFIKKIISEFSDFYFNPACTHSMIKKPTKF